MLTSVGGSPAISFYVCSSTVTHCLSLSVFDFGGGDKREVVASCSCKKRRHTMKLFRPLLASAAVVMAAAYVPPHMELPAGWTDVAAATVRLVYVV